MKKSRYHISLGLTFLILIGGMGGVACRQEPDSSDLSVSEGEASLEKKILYYTCGMHPSVRVTPDDFAAGNVKCPICQMDLVPVYTEDEPGSKQMIGHEHEAGESPAADVVIRLSSRAQALAEVRTETVQYHHLFKEIAAVGEITFDERRVAEVAAWVPGRLDRLFVDFTGDRVKKGGPLALIYSPDLLTTQEEYLLALDTLDRMSDSPDSGAAAGSKALVEAAKKRLHLWGISPEQVEQIKNSRKASTHMILRAPIGGTVIQKSAVAGKYVKTGEKLYTIADLSRVWMQADVYEQDLAFMEEGQIVQISSLAYPGENFFGKVAFIDPVLDRSSRTIKIRADVDNREGKLKPGMFVSAVVTAHVHEGSQTAGRAVYVCPMCPEVQSDRPGECPNCGMDLVKKEPPPEGYALAVPKSAVLDTGIRKLVYIERAPGQYLLQEITVGPEAMAVVEGINRSFFAVRSGIEEGMKVVTRANFLIDSQRQITGQAEAVYSGTLERGEDEKPPAKHIH